MTCKEGQLSPHELGTCTFQSKHSHPQWNQESVKGGGEAQKVGTFPNQRAITQEQKRREAPRPLPYYNPEITKEPKTKTKRGQ